MVVNQNNKMSKVLYIYLLAFFMCSARVISITIQKVNTCSNTTLQVRSDLCSGDPCQIKRGSNGVIEVDFEAHDNSNEMTAEVTIRIGALDVPFPEFDRDACNSHGFVCPVTKDQKYTYSYDLHILAEYPKINSVFKWILKDSSGFQDACFTMPVSLID